MFAVNHFFTILYKYEEVVPTVQGSPGFTPMANTKP